MIIRKVALAVVGIAVSAVPAMAQDASFRSKQAIAWKPLPVSMKSLLNSGYKLKSHTVSVIEKNIQGKQQINNYYVLQDGNDVVLCLDSQVGAERNSMCNILLDTDQK